jgi:hypothetical protein
LCLYTTSLFDARFSQIDPNFAADLKNFKPQLKMADIELALSKTKAAHGADSEELSSHYRNGIVHYGTEFDRLYSTLQQLVNQVSDNWGNSKMIHGLLAGEE